MASMTLSVIIWMIRRPRAAPIAVRIAISRSRAAALARSKLATLAHAMSSTHPAAANNTSKAVPVLPTI